MNRYYVTTTLDDSGEIVETFTDFDKANEAYFAALGNAFGQIAANEGRVNNIRTESTDNIDLSGFTNKPEKIRTEFFDRNDYIGSVVLENIE